MSKTVKVIAGPTLKSAHPTGQRHFDDLRTVLRPERRPRPRFSRPGEYADLYRGGDPNSQFLNKRLEEINDLLAVMEGGYLLDVGCGPGILLEHFAQGRFALFGLDRSHEMISEAARIASRQPGLTVGEVERLPYRDGCFDIILALGVLEYVVDLESAFAEIARVAKPGGKVVISMLNHESWYWLWFRHVYQYAKFAKSITNGKSHLPAMPILYDRAHLEAVMQKNGLEPTHLSYYNVNVCIEPISSRFPRMACWINSRLERFARTVFSRLINTGFLISATCHYVDSGGLSALSCPSPTQWI
ncbi:MAG TPA: class I SAM-dependent methyltransferase [Acetobacteraceae bacterium]|jgi:ubiquinone/menaquinone biosynthesis C-methylase UbiE|nr:class I SAM-dependent methyltransferase [Acetobacteraceae bacterium]